MAGKRIATSKISKDNPEAESSSGEEERHAKSRQPMGGRKISKPSAKFSNTAKLTSSNPFAALRPNELEKSKEQSNNTNHSNVIKHQDKPSERLLKLRGLNHSFSEAVKKKLDNDASCDLSSLFGQYTTHQRSIGNKVEKDLTDCNDDVTMISDEEERNDTKNSLPSLTFLEKNTTTSSTFPVIQQSNATTSFPPFITNSAIPTPAPSTLPSSFNFTSTSSTFTTSSFTTNDKPNTAIEEESTLAKPFAFGFTESQSKATAPFNFSSLGNNNTVSAPAPTPVPANDSNGFKFGSFGGDNNNSFSAKPFTFGSSLTSVPKETFNELSNSSKSDAAITSNPATGSTTPFQFSFASPSPILSFGAGISSSNNGSGNNGFSFGAFNASTIKDSKVDNVTNDNDGEDEIPVGEEASFSGDRTNTELVKKGVGEEDEDTLIEQRIKLFTFEKESASWKDFGIAIFKINQKKSTIDDCSNVKVRVLARSEGSGKLILNSWISEAIKAEHGEGKKDFTLLCTSQEGKPTQYLIRCKEVDQAKALSDKIIQLANNKN